MERSNLYKLSWELFDFPEFILMYYLSFEGSIPQRNLAEYQADIEFYKTYGKLIYINIETGEVEEVGENWNEATHNWKIFEKQFDIITFGQLDLFNIHKYLEKYPAIKGKILKSEYLTELAKNLGYLNG